MPKNVTIFEVDEWDTLVSSTYKRIYSFQQQDGCKDRGIYTFTIPISDTDIEDYERDEIPEVINGEVRGLVLKPG